MPETDYELLAADLQRQASLIANRHESLRELARDAARRLPLADRIYIVGCGDSLNIGQTVRFQWAELLGIAVEAVPAMTFARWTVRSIPRNALVITFSQSGTVVRVVEAARMAMRQGCTVLTVTASPTSPLAREPATHNVATGFPKIGFVPGTTSYTYHMLFFYELGVALAEAWNNTAADDLRTDLETVASRIGQTMSSAWEISQEHARVFTKSTPFLILGSGPDLATAHFLARKMFEVPQITALAQETEEYAHDEYSIVNPETTALVFDADAFGRSRTEEIARSLMNLGTGTAVVASHGASVDDRATFVYSVDTDGFSAYLAPLLSSIPGQVLTYHLAHVVGGSFYASADPTHSKEGDDLIYASRLSE